LFGSKGSPPIVGNLTFLYFSLLRILRDTFRVPIGSKFRKITIDETQENNKQFKKTILKNYILFIYMHINCIKFSPNYYFDLI
jgi:hypothetical protein